MEAGVKRFTENIESLAARKRNDEPVLYWEEALSDLPRRWHTGRKPASLDAEVESALGDEPHPGYRDRHQSSLKTTGPAT